MVSNKKRLYVALYPSGVVDNNERKYHWGFLIGPKNEATGQTPGLRCHVKNHPVAGWVYEEVELPNLKSTNNLLARLVVAKVEDEKHLLKTLRETAVIQDDFNFRCRTWMADALYRISKAEPRVVGTSELDWSRIEQNARRYVENKVAAGRYLEAERMLEPKPTWDMMEQREIIP
ncbi:uncharacterized protein MAM_01422 [Metarhizium album ARSEF 1941]|uniref:Uncharacterized protein n=1 Tax=Metarhizium album (strain ARSEF 1941) TaxID=1081103 RepID=A0A0B2X2V1_METAS|nr:uncharacterized protein MAM_01422 [Metarhizium album ARSEF 1941]KHO00644.1 hypothetical protein MAM_01422 [Metarhizium album ARSEF 1941]